MSEAAATSSAFQGGECIGHYRVLGMLGAGGMGAVYKAFDLQLERTVALKFLLPQAAFSDNEREQLLREAKSASQLDHANIGVVHELEQTADAHWFIVMAYYEGGTLEYKIGNLLTSQALEIAAQVARGLAEAHAHNIIHRDIKPSNVMFGAGGVVKIVDFGIARLMPTGSATLSTDARGTAAYMAPEQILGHGADHRSDIWSLGVVLAQMLTGKYPFSGNNVAAKLYAIVNHPPHPLQGIPAPVQAIVYRALAKEPADRYQNCAEMLADIEQAKVLSSQATQPLVKADHTPEFVRQLKERASTPAGAHSNISRTRIVVIIVIMAALGLLATLLFGPSAVEQIRNSWFQQREKHIAVLPFDVIGNDPDMAPLADGLMDSLTSKLSNLDTGQQQSLWVVPASVVRRQKVDDPRSALRDLGATLVVKGSIQRSGPMVRLIVNLISTHPVRQLASEDVEDESGDFASVQDQAVERLSRVMHIATGAATDDADKSRVPAAYESYLKAVGYTERYDKPGNLELAVKELNSATQRDPRFALAYAQLGEVYRWKFVVDKDPKWLDSGLAACAKAFAINDHLPTTFVASGRIHMDLGKHELSIQEFERAQQLDPRSADAVLGLARAYEKADKIGDAEQAFKKAAAMRPDYWDGYNSLGLFYRRQRRFPEAIEQLKKVIQLTPDNRNAYLNLAAVYLDTNDAKYMADAESALKHSLELGPSYAAYGNLAFMYLQQKRYAESAAMSEKAAEMNANDPQVWDNLAMSYEWLDQMDKARAARENELEVVERNAKLNPTDAQTQATLAVLYAMKRDRSTALPHIDLSLALAPKDPTVLACVGEAYELLGNRAKAIRYLHQAVANGEQLVDLERSSDLRGVLADPDFKKK